MAGSDPTFASRALAAVLATLAPETVGPASAEKLQPASARRSAAAVARGRKGRKRIGGPPESGFADLIEEDGGMVAREFDLIVIGAGAIGENVADRAVQGGLTAALVEAE